MKKQVRLGGYLAAILAALTMLPPRRGGVAGILWPLRALAEAWSFVLMLVGCLAAVAGLRRKDYKSAVAGVIGAVAAAHHVRKVTAPHDAFAEAFGADWRACMLPEVRRRLFARRFVPFAPDSPGVRWQKDVVIGTHVETGDPLLADLWQPPEGVPPTGLAVLYFHGSGWFSLDKDYGTRHFFRRLAGQGHVVLDVAYTLTPRARLRAMVADVYRAIAWMKTHAAAFGVNPERVVLAGGSAGGHLVMLAAYADVRGSEAGDILKPADVTVDTSVRAVVSYYGLPDLRAFHEHLNRGRLGALASIFSWRRWAATTPVTYLRRVRFLPPYGEMIPATDMVVRLLGGTPDEKPDVCAAGSPINYVGPHCPPTLLIQGLHDSGGMMPEVRRLHRALRDAGVTSVLVEFANTGHGFDVIFPRLSPAAQAATYDVERFLALMAANLPPALADVCHTMNFQGGRE